jgi:cephalosporin-C deacetylase-like acetyl esterase
MEHVNRRDFMRATGALASLAVSLPSGRAAPSVRSYGEEFPDMLLANLAKQLNALAGKWDAERAKIQTRADVDARNRFVRSTVRRMIHGFPERNSLNAMVVRTHLRDGYRIENVMFESRPDFWVTANLYIPTGGSGPFPGIISPCGHYPLARTHPAYQAAYLNLVKSGFSVLAYDPIGQGERRQYWEPRTGQADITDSTYEHSMPGQVLLLTGEDLTHYRVWDGMRAIDYLLTRPEVDGSKIGCMGHSGGGTLTMFISALDDRVGCAVINEGGTGNRWPLATRVRHRIEPSDVEQNLFPAALYGIDQCDLHVAIAPRPLLATIENYSPDFERAAAHIRRRYEQLGVSDRFATAEANAPHAFTPKLRLATTDWFCRWFYGLAGPSAEPEYEIEAPKVHYCTPNGSIRYANKGQTIFSLILKRGAELPPPRPAPAGGVEFEAFRSKITAHIRTLLRLEDAGHPLAVRNIATTLRRGCRIDKIEFLSEPGIYVPALVFLPYQKSFGRTILYASEAGTEDDAAEFGVLEQLARKGRPTIAVDVRGVGETALPRDCSGERFGHLFSAETAAVYMAWYMDRCLFGMRVHDLIRSVDYAFSRPDLEQSSVDVIGKGAGALWAIYAAALDGRIRAIVAERGLISYASLTRADRYLHSAGVFVRDVLKSFDLPQVAAAIAGRRLALLSPVDPMKEVDVVAARQAYEFTRQTYANQGDRKSVV